MKQRPRVYCTERHKALMWDSWRRLKKINRVGRLLFLSERLPEQICNLILANSFAYEDFRKRGLHARVAGLSGFDQSQRSSRTSTRPAVTLTGKVATAL